MHIMIIGAAGMLGHKLTKEFINQHAQQEQKKLALTLVDIIEPSLLNNHNTNITFTIIKADFSSQKSASQLAQLKPDVIYHLAAIVSGEAESNFSKGYESNVSASWQLLEAIRKVSSDDETKPKFIFSSSLAVYGPPVPKIITDEQCLHPASSYGTQKTIVEYLIADYTRKGYIQGLTLRLPTVVVRPGKPNAAASSFLSSIIREPLAGEKAILPVAKKEQVWISSPETSVKNLVHAASLKREQTTDSYSINLPGITVSIEHMIDAVINIGGKGISQLIISEKNSAIEKIVCSWPFNFDTQTATHLGFIQDQDMNSIINQHLKEQE